MDPARAGRVAAPCLSFAAPLVLYVLTCSRDLGTIDSGELAAVCTKLQVAHPTGYPLYTLMGAIASRLLPAATAIARLNLLSALCAAASCLFVFLLFRHLLARVRPRASESLRAILALGGSWLWAIHPALWSQAVTNEVHALQAAIASALLWVAAGAGARARRLLLAAYLIGLGLANHLTILYLVPGLLAGFLLDRPARRAVTPRMGLFLLGGVLVPLLLYLYLPIRSLAEPLLDWGDPTTPARLLRHIGAWQYRVWMFSSAANVQENLAAYAREIIGWRTLPALAAAAAGLVLLARSDRPALARLLIGWMVGVAWASGYEIHDIEPYFLVARLCFAACAIAGASLLLPEAARAGVGARAALAPLATLPIVAALALGAARLPAHDRRGDRFPRLYAESLLSTLPENAILITRHWDMVVSPILYLQQIEGSRRDVTVVDTELLRRSWYYPELRRADPALLAPIEERVEAFLEQVRLFEAGRAYNARVIEERYQAVIAGLFEQHRGERAVFHTPEVEPTFYRGWTGVPEALAVRMVADPFLAPVVDPLEPGAWEEQRRYVDEPVRRQAFGFPTQLARARVRFLEATGRGREAESWRAAAERLAAIEIPRGSDALD